MCRYFEMSSHNNCVFKMKVLGELGETSRLVLFALEWKLIFQNKKNFALSLAFIMRLKAILSLVSLAAVFFLWGGGGGVGSVA